MSAIESMLETFPEFRDHADLIVVPPTAEEALDEHPELEDSPDLLARGDLLIKHDGEGNGITLLAWYMICRRKGTKHKFAVSLALRQTSATQTTDTFWSGRKPFHAVYGTRYADEVRAALARRGVRLGETAEYMPELARFKGDPEAVVPFSGARDHIRRICEKRGLACDGAVSVKAREPLSDPLAKENCVPLGEDIIRSNMRGMVQGNPDLARKSRRELRQMVIEKHGIPG